MEYHSFVFSLRSSVVVLENFCNSCRTCSFSYILLCSNTSFFFPDVFGYRSKSIFRFRCCITTQNLCYPSIIVRAMTHIDRDYYSNCMNECIIFVSFVLISITYGLTEKKGGERAWRFIKKMWYGKKMQGKESKIMIKKSKRNRVR